MARDAAHAASRGAAVGRLRSPPVRIAVIVNAAAGRRASAARAARRLALAGDILSASGFEYEVAATEYAGHARELARRALDRGASTIAAWGGDGTVNEVGSVVAFTDAALAIVPGGSGNGLAYALGVPRDPSAALRQALSPGERRIDAGEIDGRLFFNLAGFGFDAHVAELFARRHSRGLRGYVAIAARELFAFRPPRLHVTVGDEGRDRTLLLLVVANGTQWGRNARIAPHAVPDDGQLDLVSVRPRSVLRIAWQIPRLFRGAIDGAPGITFERVTSVRIGGEPPLLFHVDGEPVRSAARELTVRIHPAALRVRA